MLSTEKDMPEEKETTITPTARLPGGWRSQLARALYGGHGRPAAVALHAIFGGAISQPLGNLVFDTYQRLFPRQVDRFPVVIVDIDEQSINALGRWPWPRTRLARLTDAAHRLGALSIGYDIIMPEPDQLSPEVVLAHRRGVSPAVRQELDRLPSNDVILMQTLRRTPSVVARAALIDSESTLDDKSSQTAVNIVGTSPLAHLPSYADHLANITGLEKAAFGCGYLNDTRDRDGVVRSMPLLINVNDQLAPTLALELLRTALGANWYSVHAGTQGVHFIQIGNSRIPVDPDGRIRIHFSPAYADRRVSALAVLKGSLPANAFANQVAIIGVTGVGTIDVVATPVAARMDGVEIQAQVVENILANTRLVRPAVAPTVEFVFFLLIAGACILFLPRVHPGYGILVYLFTAGLLAGSSLLAFWAHRQLFDPTFPITGSALVVVMLMTAGFAASKRRHRELNAALEAERLERVRISGELQAAREIQMGMLPDPSAVAGLPPHIDLYALLEPATEVGGDLYDAFMIDERHFFFIVGDVAGKGVAASLFMALSKTLCKSTALRTGVSLEALINAANEEISRDNPGMLFVTAIAGIVDVKTGKTQLCRAGHDAPILARPGVSPQFMEIEAGPPLCVLENFRYPARQAALLPGDALVLISDGITEAQNLDEALYGRDRILDYLQKRNPAQSTAEELCRGLYAEVKQFSGTAIQSDDITIMAIRFLETNQVGSA